MRTPLVAGWVIRVYTYEMARTDLGCQRLSVMLFRTHSGVGEGVGGHNKVCLPQMGLRFRASFVDSVFLLRKMRRGRKQWSGVQVLG